MDAVLNGGELGIKGCGECGEVSGQRITWAVSLGSERDASYDGNVSRQGEGGRGSFRSGRT